MTDRTTPPTGLFLPPPLAAPLLLRGAGRDGGDGNWAQERCLARLTLWWWAAETCWLGARVGERRLVQFGQSRLLSGCRSMQGNHPIATQLSDQLCLSPEFVALVAGLADLFWRRSCPRHGAWLARNGLMLRGRGRCRKRGVMGMRACISACAMTRRAMAPNASIDASRSHLAETDLRLALNFLFLSPLANRITFPPSCPCPRARESAVGLHVGPRARLRRRCDPPLGPSGISFRLASDAEPAGIAFLVRDG